MKTTLIISSVILAIVLITQGWTFIVTNDVETQAYEVLEKDGDFEIRFYPEALMATTKTVDGSYDQSSGKLFGTLGGYIFGDNEQEQEIAMTSPVHMDFSDSSTSMSFVMPSKYSLDDLPAPNAENIQFHLSEAETVATLQFGGYSNDERIAQKTQELKDLLAQRNIETIGPFRYLGYDPPFKVMGRRNEVIVRVRLAGSDS